jgi:hypothetical protein
MQQPAFPIGNRTILDSAQCSAVSLPSLESSPVLRMKSESDSLVREALLCRLRWDAFL